MHSLHSGSCLLFREPMRVWFLIALISSSTSQIIGTCHVWYSAEKNALIPKKPTILNKIYSRSLYGIKSMLFQTQSVQIHHMQWGTSQLSYFAFHCQALLIFNKQFGFNILLFHWGFSKEPFPLSIHYVAGHHCNCSCQVIARLCLFISKAPSSPLE